MLYSLRLWMLTACLLLIAGVAYAQSANPAVAQPLSVQDYETIAKYRQEAAALVQEQSELSWKRRTTGEKVDIAATYKGHENLFSMATVDLLQRAGAAASNADQRKALEYFRDYVLSEMVKMRVAALDDEISNYLASAEFTYAGKTYQYYQQRELLQNETEYGQRQVVSDSVLPILRKANELYRTKEERMRRLAKELGFADYSALAEQLRHVNLEQFAAVCERLLKETQGDYLNLQRWAGPFQLGFPAEKLRRCDLPRLFKNIRFDKYFGKDEMVPRLKQWLADLGLSMDKIKIDAEDRPKKNPRAACYPISVPADVRLTIKPAGGQGDYTAFWHEMGHALHFSYTATPVWEFQQLGDNVTTETYAFLFDSMLGNRFYTQHYLALKDPDLVNETRYNAYIKMYLVRRYCAKVLYELELHRGGADPNQRYRQLLGRAYAIELDENDGLRYLEDVDDFFYSADYMRAWITEAMLRNRLQEQFSDEWYLRREAGAYLAELWKTGQFYGGDELVRHLGYEGLDPKYLTAQMKQSVKKK